MLARTHEQLAMLRAVLAAPASRCAARRSGGQPARGALATAAALPSAAQTAGLVARCARDAAAGRRRDDAASRAGRAARSLRQRSTSCASSPTATAATFRSWIATSARVRRAGSDNGVELLTFHAAKGREWHTVVVTGVETGLVPHRSATTVDAKAEEARLLHVAMTRASDRLMLITYAERRRGYARKPSPLIAGLPTDAGRRSSRRRRTSTADPTSSPCGPTRCTRGAGGSPGRGAATGADLFRCRPLGDRRAHRRRARGAAELSTWRASARYGGAGVRADPRCPRPPRDSSARLGCRARPVSVDSHAAASPGSAAVLQRQAGQDHLVVLREHARRRHRS